MRISRHKRLVLGVVLVPTLLGLTACGGGSQTYATDKSDGVYFTVPEHWQKLSQSALSAREAQSTVAGAADRLANVHWQEAYAPSALTAAQVFSLKSNGYPTVYVPCLAQSCSPFQPCLVRVLLVRQMKGYG